MNNKIKRHYTVGGIRKLLDEPDFCIHCGLLTNTEKDCPNCLRIEALMLGRAENDD